MKCAMCNERCRGSIGCEVCGIPICYECSLLMECRCPECVERENVIKDREIDEFFEEEEKEYLDRDEL